jgi:hypothetical protein
LDVVETVVEGMESSMEGAMKFRQQVQWRETLEGISVAYQIGQSH